MDYAALPIGSHVTLTGADVRLTARLETLGFSPVRIDNPAAPTKIVMCRHTGPLLPILRPVRPFEQPRLGNS